MYVFERINMGNNHLTARQAQIYEFLKGYFLRNGHSPYLREIQDGCQVKSHKSVIDKLLALERKGYIRRRLNKHRSIKLVAQKENQVV
ncbi:MAG: LexA repressor [Candidatus Omnitrophota bacterium]|nr:LexA repressor [Candidatus Omnitrophota bacterium]